MANLRGFKFFDFSSTEMVSNVLSNPNKGEALTIEVSDDGSAPKINLIVESKSDLESNDSWHQVAVISLRDYSIHTEITAGGIYSASFSGLSKYRIRSTQPLGHIKVFAMVTD